MTKIADTFNVKTTRPLNALNSVSIAELAQFTRFETDGRFPVADAESTLRREWAYEVDAMHDLNHLDMKKAVLWFKDGSTLTITRH
jgi:hypothetical protein